MSVLRYNVVSDKKPYRPNEEHLRSFCNNVRRETRPIESTEESTLVSERATADVADNKGRGGGKVKRSKTKRKTPTKKVKPDDKINGHKFK
jgi:hypothetical protein